VKATSFAAHDGFYPRADRLRAVFDQRFADPLRATAERFVWDYWHLPGEYTHLRTPAYTYFPKTAYEHFHRYLVNWGRENLGCHDISPPWLSCYVEGCRQEPHRDVPHGPLAFVYSLTPWRGRRFRGGETFITRPRALVEAKYNRLTIFNPALTHGVRPVRGTHDPREGRLVIHGWFVNPRPFWTGPLGVDEVRDAVEVQLPRLTPPNLDLGAGLLSLRLSIGADGRVVKSRVLISTLTGGRAGHAARLIAAVNACRFSKRRAVRTLTLPLLTE